MKLAMMHIFLVSYKEDDYNAFVEAFKQVKAHGVHSVSISPVRDYGEYGEVYATLQIEDDRIEEILAFMSDGWDGDCDDCQCNAFTSKVFESHINSLYFQLPDD